MYRIKEQVLSSNFQQIKNVVSRKNNKFALQNSVRHYDSGTSSPPSKSGIVKKLVYTSGVTIALIGGITYYARFDQKFRKILEEYVPGSDAFIKFVYQEDKSYLSNVKNSISNTSERVVSSVYELVGKGEKSEKLKSSVTTPPPLIKAPKPSLKPSTEKKETPVTTEQPKQESSHKEVKNEVSSIEKPSVLSEKSEDYQKYNISELEQAAIDAVKLAIVAYNNTINDLKDYKEEVANLIEKSVQKDDYTVWFKIKEKTKNKEKIIKKAEESGKIAMNKIEHLKLLINNSNISWDPTVKFEIENKMKTILNDLVYTKALFTQERTDSSVIDKFSKRVEESRQILSKELGLLFPSLIVDSEQLVTEEELDLFVMYTCQLLNFYQKELQKLGTVGKLKINKIIEKSKAGNPEVIKEIVDVETEKLKRDFAQELMKQELRLKRDYEKELMTNLRRQNEVHSDHLGEIISLKEKETERILKQNIDEKIENMRTAYNRQLAKVIGRMKGLDTALKEKIIAEKQAKRSQLLWNACQALILAIKSEDNTKSWENQLKPLENEVNAISKAAVEEDTLVGVVIASIPSEAISRGVFSELALRDRFLNVERIAFRLANLPEGFLSLPTIFLSYLQSFLLVQFAKPIPTDELNNEPFDVSSLNNYDILCRARYWLDRGDFQQTLKYMNLLKGAARSISEEWMKEARIFLETQQAAKLLSSHAVYSNFIYLQNSN